MNVEFGKKEAQLIKGIAIILMFYHHFFGFPSWLASDCGFIHTYIGGYSLEGALASFSKICVGLYAFISGYVLFYQFDIYSDIKLIFLRALRFLFNYWFVFSIFIIFGIIFNEPLPSFTRFLQQCFGISTATGFNWEFFDAIHPVFAWYVSFYLMFLFISPLLAKLCRFNFATNVLLMSSILFLCSYLINILLPVVGYHPIRNLITSFATWGHIGMLGFLFAKHDIFNIIHTMLSKKVNKVSLFILMILLLSVIFFLWTFVDLKNIYISDYINVSFLSIYTPIFIYALCNILNIISSRVINSILIKLSKESTNMWFLHGLFFTPNKTIQWIAYLPQNPVLILIWTLLLMYYCSVVLNTVTTYVGSFMKRKCCP